MEPEEYPDIQEQKLQEEATEQKIHETLGANQLGFAEFLHETTPLPESIRKHFGIFFTKELGLTNIMDNEELERMMLHFKICKRNYHIYNSVINRTAENEILISQLEAAVRAKLLRSMGGRMRDRALFHTTLTSHERQQEARKGGGLFSRFKRSVV